jgi:hypothetical protein
MLAAAPDLGCEPIVRWMLTSERIGVVALRVPEINRLIGDEHAVVVA